MSRYPPISRPASDFGRSSPRRAARLARLGARPACLPRDLPPGPVDVLCPRPLHHVLEYEALYGFLAALRSGRAGAGVDGDDGAAAGGEAGRRRRVRVFLRSALADWSPFARLPADEVGRLPEAGETAACAQLLRRLAASAAAREGGAPGATGAGCLLLGPDPGWESLAAGLPGVRRCDPGPEFRWRLPASAEATRASDDFFTALQRSSPRWLAAAALPPSLAAAAASRRPPSFLVHQGRSHLGDMLWLTPLLRAITLRFPGARVTVAGAAAAAQALANNPHCAELLRIDPPPDGSSHPAAAARAGLLDRLRRQRFDAALFAFASRPQCRWLAAAAAELEIPLRVDLEYFEGAGDGRDLDPLFTHQGWFFWGTLASPRLLLHLLDPLAPIASTAATALTAPSTAPAATISTASTSPTAPAAPAASTTLGASCARLEYFAVPRWRQAAADRLASHGCFDRPFAVLAPGARSSELWPPRKFAALARRLAADLGFHVLIEGGPADAPVLDAVAGHLGSSLPALPDAPSTAPRVAVYQDPLGVLAALLERASLLVSNDSAPIHLAETCAAPTVYFAHREKLTHSHPTGPACWALFDGGRNRLARITVDQAMAAIAEMVRLGEVRRVVGFERVERVETGLAAGP